MGAAVIRLFASPRGAILLTFCAFGTFVGLWAGSVPEIARRAAIGSYELGVCLSLFTIAYVVCMSLGPRLAVRFGNRRLIVSLLLTLIPISVLLFASASVGSYLIAIVALGVSLSLLDLFMNAEASAIESDLQRPIFAAFHGAASLGTAVAAIAGSLIALSAGPAGAIPVVLSVVAIAVWRVAATIPDRQRPTARAEQPRSKVERRSFQRLIRLGVVAGLAMAGETASILWSAKLLDEQAPAIAAFAGAGAAFFGICHASVRFAGDRLRARFGDIPLIAVSLAIAAIGYAGVGLSSSFALSILAFALTGLGSACVIPIIFSLAAREIPESRAAGLGVIALVSGVPRIAAPWVFGWVAELWSTTFAFGAIAIAMLAALAVVLTINTLAPDKG